MKHGHTKLMVVRMSDISEIPTCVGHHYNTCPTRGLTCLILKILFFDSDTHRTQLNMARTRAGHSLDAHWIRLDTARIRPKHNLVLFFQLFDGPKKNLKAQKLKFI